MNLTEYQQNIFKKLDDMEKYKWFAIDANREDRDKLIEALKLYVDVFGNILEFDSMYTKFRLVKIYNGESGITVSFEFHKREDVFIDYSHLPEPEFKTYSKKEWDKKSGRAQ